MESKQYLVDIYRRYFESFIPYSAMLFMYKIGAFPFLKRRISEIFTYYETEKRQNGGLGSDLEEVLAYLKKDPFQLLPYPFVRNYGKRHTKIYRDRINSMYYVVEDDKKLYFKRGMTESEVRNRFNALSSEQDILSPHRYLSAGYHMFGADFEPIDLCAGGVKEFGVNNNDIVADLGTAEGNFAISIVDMAEKLYLFECDKEWVRALEQTFKPFAHKTVIVEKMVSDRTDFNSVSIDDYFERKPLHFIKADLEGYESKALLGAKNTIETAKHMKIAVCTYHACEHASLFSDYFCERGFDVQFSRGYMHPWTILNASPYLTKGVLRARR